MKVSYSVVLLLTSTNVIYCCFINPCNYSEYCKNGGECVFLDDQCTAVCKCTNGYTGERCDRKFNESDFDCRSCHENQTCFHLNNAWTCVTLSTSTETVVNTTTETVVNTPVQTAEIPRNVCSEDYVNREDSERFCLGYNCVYGWCNKSYEDVGGIQTLTTKCACDPGARGTKYTDMSDPIWIWWLVGGCVLAFFLLLVLLILVPYCLWKKRVLVVMKVAYFFQSYEDNDDKVWDAFVSYKSAGADEDFVMNKLQPVLEDQLGFRLCLHYRDFVIGAAIFENIIEAINNSRRTILVLSPRFLSSEWTRYEYQVALQEMLKKKHRIIPIILEDISAVENVDETLKQILSSITYIKWPESEKKEKNFWKTLQLSLPKKRVESSSGSTSTGISSVEPPSPTDSVPSDYFSTDQVINGQSKVLTSDINDVNIDIISNSFFSNNIAYINSTENAKPNAVKVISDEVYNSQYLSERL
ncbi:uncharacterized protein LOC125668095 isoform X2 [Ostrea edulis]|uniref:uncharacterized protein LOC125668095 isoform X2 n=1 Tax=Ostrea edulis TaxID=37623 RepID=UPI0024AF2DAC|nr:uncharacterized protein LOC125668095 isoform X2 [Ostrea edulis]